MLLRRHHASPTSPIRRRNHIADASESPHVRARAKSQAFDAERTKTLQNRILQSAEKPRIPAPKEVVHGRPACRASGRRWPGAARHSPSLGLSSGAHGRSSDCHILSANGGKLDRKSVV